MSQYLVTGIGKRIRQIRKERRLTLSVLAERAGVSKGLVSKIENSRTVPSLPVLFELIHALDYTAELFFKGLSFSSAEKYLLRRAGEQTPLQREEESKGFHYAHIMENALRQGSVEVVILRLDPRAEREMVTTDAYEYKYLLEGSVVYQIEEEFIPMEAGDTLFFDGRIPHVPHNRSDKPARMLVFYLFPNHTQE